MNGWRALFEGWRCRSRYPEFRQGQQITACVTGYDRETDVGHVRVGDTVLKVPGLDENLVDRTVKLRVESFDSTKHVGEARYLETVGEGSF